MTRPIVFLDTETTHLHPELARAWEIAVIVRRPGQPDHEQSFFVHADCLNLGYADPMALQIGRFYERHPHADDYVAASPMAIGRGPKTPRVEHVVLRTVEQLTRGAIVYGSNPAFDMDVLGRRMRANGILPSWHYGGECLATAAKWWLKGRGMPLPESEKSEDLSRAIGVDPDGFDRHTALGDCRWTRAMFDRMNGPAPVLSDGQWGQVAGVASH